MVKEDPTVSSIFIKEKLNLNCSARTIRGFLIKNNLKSRIQAQKDALNPRHIQMRFEFSNEWLEHEAFNSENIFCDENTFL